MRGVEDARLRKGAGFAKGKSSREEGERKRAGKEGGKCGERARGQGEAEESGSVGRSRPAVFIVGFLLPLLRSQQS